MSNPKTLYHYCSPENFLRILQSREIQLSALKLSNDTLEGKLVARTLLRIAERNKMDEQHRQRLLEMLEFFETSCEGLGFCLSADGDLLSQWRGYANDGAGIAIGFSTDYLRWHR